MSDAKPGPKPTDPLAIKCWICNAKPGERCSSIVDASKYFDVPHAARRELARRSA